MDRLITSPDPAKEFFTQERCWILEIINSTKDDAVSIARARVEPGVTTQLHRLNGVDERYLIIAGKGAVRVGGGIEHVVGEGDVVVIPSGMSQQIANIGPSDLLFYCICSPRFAPDCYETLE
ncbi:cupin domain-containing protein [Lysobacter cavernae]|uniref:Cupin domain-containing protein n=1 Tax=Lysobacter cavernae TaxID=1685901 RepID=A0ABV7RKD2_9GAMM